MRLSLILLTAVFASLSTTALSAETMRLTCKMTDYGASSRVKNIRQAVPQQAVHVLDGLSVTLEGTNQNGKVKSRGSRISLQYESELDGVGDAFIDYTFIPSNGKMIAKTRGMKSMPWEEDFPERAGKYIIRGQCRVN